MDFHLTGSQNGQKKEGNFVEKWGAQLAFGQKGFSAQFAIFFCNSLFLVNKQGFAKKGWLNPLGSPSAAPKLT